MHRYQILVYIIFGSALSLAACTSENKAANGDSGLDSSDGMDSGGETDSDGIIDTHTEDHAGSDTDSETTDHVDTLDGEETDSGSDGDTGTDGSPDTDTDTQDKDTGGNGDTATEDSSPCVDEDSDDWCQTYDCDDQSAQINPDADEVFDPPNKVDEDCDGLTDEANASGLEDWEMYLTVDNMFDVYFGTPTQTTGILVGGGADWRKEFHFTAEDRNITDYMYVATASDHSEAQGFLGTFTNLTRGKTTNTGDAVWEVFPAGAHEATNPYWPAPWPKSLMPTQAQVDKAIAYAEANNLWVTPISPPGYDNDPNTSIAPATKEWRPLCNPQCAYDHIPNHARWIWHDTGNGPTTAWAAPLAGYNHDEFLVFRVAGAVPPVN